MEGRLLIDFRRSLVRGLARAFFGGFLTAGHISGESSAAIGEGDRIRASRTGARAVKALPKSSPGLLDGEGRKRESGWRPDEETDFRTADFAGDCCSWGGGARCGREQDGKRRAA